MRNGGHLNSEEPEATKRYNGGVSMDKLLNPGLEDAKKNNRVKGLLFQPILEDLILQIGNLKTGKEILVAITTRNLGVDRVKEARLQILITEFVNMKMSDNDTINAYDAKLSGFEDVVGRLKAYKERVKEEDKANDAQENLFYARTEYSNRNNNSSRGRGCGSYSRGRGCGQGSGRGNTQNHAQRDSSKNGEDNKQKGKQH
ncbi:hypothetical protein Tco_0818109 [Tanacetum coccineum]